MYNDIKKDIRKQILQQRESLNINIRLKRDEIIYDKLINSEFYKNAHTIFAFVSFKSEVDTHKIIKHALEDGKTICIPKIESKAKGIELFKITSFNQLKEGYFGILEPSNECEAVEGYSIDLILMPGVAFDRQGGRLGYGAAFYDRFLSKLKKHVDKIALAYQLQVIDSVPMDDKDVPIDGVITEEEFILTNK